MHALRRIRKTVLVGFAAINLLAAPGLAVAGDFEAELEADHRAVFFESGYQYCDAHVLSLSWGQSIDEAKSHIGWKVTEGSREVLDEQLHQARVQAWEANDRCYYDAGDAFGYADANLLATLWGLSVDEAKARISFKVAVGNANFVAAELRHHELESMEEEDILGELGANELDGLELTEREQFDRSGYGYCDATVLAAHWQVDLEQAKVMAGYKWSHGLEVELADALAVAAEAHREAGQYCWLGNSDIVGPEDAPAFMAHWGLDETETLVRLDTELSDGNVMELEALKRELTGSTEP